MESHNVRKGITNAKFNEDNAGILAGEIAIVAIAAGFYFHSWYIGGSLFLGLMIAMFIKPLAILIILALSICWGLVGYFIGVFFESTGAMVVLSILGFLMGLGANLSALEWVQDIGNGNEQT